jgi:broad specificity phosphatase PhoE
MSQTLHLIRHGHSLHNELFHKIGVQAFRIPLTIDSPLTNEGHLQSIELGQSWLISSSIAFNTSIRNLYEYIWRYRYTY